MIESSDTSQKILTAAAEEFARHGLAGARVDRIARLAGVNKAMLYYHFKSKENLYQTIIDSRVQIIKAFFDNRLVDFETNPEDIFASIADFYVSIFRDQPPIGPIFLRELAEGGERLKKAFLETLTRYPARRMKEILNEGMDDGRFRRLDPRHTVISFIGMNLFYLIMAPIVNLMMEIDDEDEFRSERSQAVVDLFMHGLLSRQP